MSLDDISLDNWSVLKTISKSRFFFINLFFLNKVESHNQILIKRLKDKTGGMLYFDELILGGCKFYALRMERDVKVKEITKCKGYKTGKDGSDLTFDNLKKMDGGEPHDQKQVQFLCPKMNHVSMDEKFAVRTRMVPKWFKFAYTKGDVADDGSITPFYL